MSIVGAAAITVVTFIVLLEISITVNAVSYDQM